MEADASQQYDKNPGTMAPRSHSVRREQPVPSNEMIHPARVSVLRRGVAFPGAARTTRDA